VSLSYVVAEVWPAPGNQTRACYDRDCMSENQPESAEVTFIGFVLSLRGRGGGAPPNPNSQPPPPRWGRRAG